MTDDANVHKYHPFPGQMLEHVDLEEADYELERRRHQARELDYATTFTSVMVHEDGWSFRHENDPTDSAPVADWLESAWIDRGEVMHRPCLDLDLAAHVIPSSTPGHCHLLIDKPMTWTTYVTLLHALADAGIVEANYVAVSEKRGHTSLRLPWIRKAASNAAADPWAPGPPMDGTDQDGPF